MNYHEGDVPTDLPPEPEGEHHPLGPSALKYIEICPSYRSSGETNPAAEEGTLLHLACETNDLSPLDSDQVSLVKKVLEYMEGVRKDSTFVLKERKVSIELNIGDVLFGSIDELIVFKDQKRADVCDYKFGRNPIEDADVNPQTLAYAIGTFQLFPYLEEITVHFIIPRRDELLRHTFTRDDLAPMIDRVKLIVQRAHADPPQYNPNTEGCGWCGKRAVCPALADKLLPIAKKYTSSSEDFEIALMDKMDPALIDDPETISKMKSVATILDKWGSAVNKRALEMAVEGGIEIPGYGLHFRAASSKVDDTQAAYDSLSNLMSPEEFMGACTVSVPALSKVVKNKLPHGEKNKARSKIEQSLMASGVLPDEDDVVTTPYLRKQKK
jgi:hypothetical protein